MASVKRRKTVGLRTFFLQYLLFLCIGTLLYSVLLLGLFTAALSSAFILPANYAEKQLMASRDILATSSEVTPDMIPELADYALFSMDGKLIAGNLTEKEAAYAWAFYQKSGNWGSSHFYEVIQRKDDICIIRYSLVPQYASSVLRHTLPNPQLLGIVLFIAGMLLQSSVLAARFGKKLSRKLSGLQEATEQIRNENLEFTVKPCGIREIDDVLASLDRMKDALSASLRQQWSLEQSRREQISALAHDIKTPLTVIRGNTELLQETAQDDVQREYTGFILNSAGEIEAFVNEMIDLSNMQNNPVRQKIKVSTEDFLAELESRMRALSSGKNLRTFVHKESVPTFIRMDKELLYRALLNVIVNAIEHTPPDGSVTLQVHSAPNGANVIHFTVTDTGRGFSSTDLKHAAKQFYRGDQSRSLGSSHHGMGLYIALSAAQNHRGTLSMENDSSTGGGKVTLTIPVGDPDAG